MGDCILSHSRGSGEIDFSDLVEFSNVASFGGSNTVNGSLTLDVNDSSLAGKTCDMIILQCSGNSGYSPARITTLENTSTEYPNMTVTKIGQISKVTTVDGTNVYAKSSLYFVKNVPITGTGDPAFSGSYPATITKPTLATTVEYAHIGIKQCNFYYFNVR